ncbi:MAG: outer membrane lipoprotein SlyB [Verrucomicrobiales bacterium]|jgi:outer membrane lipoprotein SlyB
MKNTFILIGAIAAFIGLSSCQTAQQSGTLVGSVAGAGIGAIAGNNIDGISKTEGAIAGALVGGLAGNLYGRQQDQINHLESNNRTTVHVRNSNGSTTPVFLNRSGSGWVGPRGEYYDDLPDQSQLRPVYGF